MECLCSLSSGAHINPYSGAIDGWYIEDNAVLVPPTGPQITQQQAQRIAYNTVTQLTGLSGTLVQNGPMWETLSNSTTLARLQYGFGYETPEVTIPAPDPEYPDESWTGKIFVGVSVDAETGEVLSAR